MRTALTEPAGRGGRVLASRPGVGMRWRGPGYSSFQVRRPRARVRRVWPRTRGVATGNHLSDSNEGGCSPAQLDLVSEALSGFNFFKKSFVRIGIYGALGVPVITGGPSMSTKKP